jgi:glycerol-3-phosphate dehydrogenase
MKKIETQVLIIGGGITGTGLARDLALRGLKCIVVEKEDINSGASGANHGLLHSGARYVSSDLQSAAECMQESVLLKRMAQSCIEDTGGLFVAVEGDNENYIADFPLLCEKAGIPVKQLDPHQTPEIEPAVSKKVIAAYAVQDASVDPFKLSLLNLEEACRLGSTLLRHTRVENFVIDHHCIRGARVRNMLTGGISIIEAEQVINASGAWAKEIAALAGISFDLTYSKGSLLITHSRIAQRVINRLRPSANADILVPGGTVSILGTTSVTIDSLDQIFPTVAEIDLIVAEGSVMIPVLENTRFIRAYSGVRPLFGSGNSSDDRQISRSFALLDHARDGVENFASITGGKLTTYRLMAEKTADLICGRMGIQVRCRTRTEPLPAVLSAGWTQPGLAPKLWLQGNGSKEILLCECEMVSRGIIDSLMESIREQHGTPDLKSLGVRSRIGKGACQGTFCSIRIAAYLYDSGELNDDQGIIELRSFLNERWRGVRPLLWKESLSQAELQEALHCAMFGLELY